MKRLFKLMLGISMVFVGALAQAEATSTDYLDLGVQAYTFGRGFEKKVDDARNKLGLVVKSFETAQKNLNELKTQSERPNLTSAQQEDIMAKMLTAMVTPLKDFDAFLTVIGSNIIAPAMEILEAVPLDQLKTKLTFKSGKTFSQYTKENIEFFNLMIKVLSKNLPQVSETLKMQAKTTQALKKATTELGTRASQELQATVREAEKPVAVNLDDL